MMKFALLPALCALLADLSMAAVPLHSTTRMTSMFESDELSGAPTNPSLMWTPLRSSFRPLAREPEPPTSPSPPIPPSPPTPPEAPEPPEALRRSFSSGAPGPFGPGDAPSRVGRDVVDSMLVVSTAAPDDDEQPTRVPLTRFRPTRPPAADEDTVAEGLSSSMDIASGSGGGGTPLATPWLKPTPPPAAQNGSTYEISGECFECICEASSNCNPQSRCQTSDVRHTRCGLLLVSYDQWLDSGLSRQLVTREQLARDVAADERAFYECVTRKNCAQQVLSAYMRHNLMDCDRDGRLDCYDVAAIHQGGRQNCNSEALLDSQYWSDFNACYGFARRR